MLYTYKSNIYLKAIVKNMLNLLEGNDLVNKNPVQQYFPFIKEIYRLYKQKPQPYKNNIHNGILFY